MGSLRVHIRWEINEIAMSFIFRTMKEAEANKLMLTPQYLELKFIEAITNNSKIFFGDKVRLILSLHNLSLALYTSIYIRLGESCFAGTQYAI